MKMGLFMLSEFIEIAIISALFTTLFLGGYNLPFLTTRRLRLPRRRHAGALATAGWSCCSCCRSSARSSCSAASRS